MKAIHRKKRRVSGIFLVIAALIIMQLPVSEADAASSASDFKIKGSTLVKYQGTEKNVSVPNTVETIGESAFEGDTNIELVVLPKSVKHIEAYAFWGCDNLDTVVLGTGLKEVGDYAFAKCKGLEQMSIPDNVSNIGMQAFVDCVNMTDITIPPEVTSIHDTAFDGCYKLKIHCEPGSVADKYAQELYERQKDMTEYEAETDKQPGNEISNQPEDAVLEQPESRPDEDAGNGSDMSFEEPGILLGSTYVVGNRAVVFMDNTGSSVLEHGNISGDGTGQGISAEDSFKVESMPGAGGLSKYTIVDGRVVADQAYYRNRNLDNVALPEGIWEIGEFAFARSSLQSISIPSGVTEISYGAFYHCDNLMEVSLPETVMQVAPKAFAYSGWIEKFLEEESDDFLISGGILIAYKGNASQVAIPEGVRVIAAEAFLGHPEITQVSFPDSLASVGERAFADCSGLSEVAFGSRSALLEIKDGAFAGGGLSAITLPASLERLGIKAFDETVQVTYEGSEPKRTYEESAQRLSNGEFRNLSPQISPSIEKDTKEKQLQSVQNVSEEIPGVSVIGLEDAIAYLEGADRAYTLSVTVSDASYQSEGAQTLLRAYARSFGSAFPENIMIYELQFSDSSNIPLTKLGKQKLTVTMPVPSMFMEKGIRVYATDRNGQLEEVDSERLSDAEGIEGEALRFTLNYVSPIVICES